MTPLHAVGLVAFFLGGTAATYLESRARRRLSPKGEGHPWTVYLLGVWAGSDEFTAEGWRYHKRAMVTVAVTAAIALPLIFWR